LATVPIAPVKTNLPVLKTRIRILLTPLRAAMAMLLAAAPAADAGYIITLKQVGSDVVATGSGAIDLTDLFFSGFGGVVPSLSPSFMFISMGLPEGSTANYVGSFSGPRNFGQGGITFASSGSGDAVFLSIGTDSRLGVPRQYVSGTALSDSATYNNATFASLHVTSGTYKWTWGNGVNQNFTLKIGVPDPGSTVGLLLLGLAALFGVSRLRLAYHI